MSQLVHVPLKNGTGELEEGTVVTYNESSLPVYVADGGFRSTVTAAIVPWSNGQYISRVFKQVDLPEPKITIPKNIGAILRSTINSHWYMIRVSDTHWYGSHSGENVTNAKALEIMAFENIYVAYDGLSMTDSE